MTTNISTELMKALASGTPVEEFFRRCLEEALNELLKSEITAFLGYERYRSEGRNSGDSRNGYYSRTFKTRYGEVKLAIPRDREGIFHQKTIPDYKRSSNELETTVIQLYRKGITTREIADLIEKMYGHHYSPATVSSITQSVSEQVKEFHARRVAAEYAVVYCDATYLNLRRDSVSKEALHVLLGITPEGYKEVIDYAIYPTESASNYAEMLSGLKERNMKKVLLFVSDGLTGLPEALQEQFPGALHQSCWVHLSRNVCKQIRVKDRVQILAELKEVYTQQNAEQAEQKLNEFISKNEKKYPRLKKLFERRSSLYSFFRFPESIRSSLYTSNLIENNNKGLKHRAKSKEQFPNEESLDRFVCGYYCDYNRSNCNRVHKGFKVAQPFLEEMLRQME